MLETGEPDKTFERTEYLIEPAVEPVTNEIAEDDDQYDDSSETSKEKTAHRQGLPWLVNDFSSFARSVYEAVMVASARARQIGRSQKQEIDVWYKSHEPVDGQGEEEETEPGVDHFLHPKPTIKALDELSAEKVTYRYLDEDDN